jgi:hypothetical protein
VGLRSVLLGWVERRKRPPPPEGHDTKCLPYYSPKHHGNLA